MLVYMWIILQNVGRAIIEPDKYFSQLFTPNRLGFLSWESVTGTKSSLSKVHGEFKTGTTENMIHIDEYKLFTALWELKHLSIQYVGQSQTAGPGSTLSLMCLCVSMLHPCSTWVSVWPKCKSSLPLYPTFMGSEPGHRPEEAYNVLQPVISSCSWDPGKSCMCFLRRRTTWVQMISRRKE